jgi:peptidoglycan/LPS O-acetylase OafA/YrhL
MRNIGLDIARSCAIILVLISHSRFFFIKYIDLKWMSFNGFLGVEIFVLSGFLIRRITTCSPPRVPIITRQLIVCPSLKTLLTFYKRRWYRTLPLYFLAVLVLFLVGQPFHWSNPLFIQNLVTSIWPFFQCHGVCRLKNGSPYTFI